MALSYSEPEPPAKTAGAIEPSRRGRANAVLSGLQPAARGAQMQTLLRAVRLLHVLRRLLLRLEVTS